MTRSDSADNSADNLKLVTSFKFKVPHEVVHVQKIAGGENVRPRPGRLCWPCLNNHMDDNE